MPHLGRTFKRVFRVRLARKQVALHEWREKIAQVRYGPYKRTTGHTPHALIADMTVSPLLIPASI